MVLFPLWVVNSFIMSLIKIFHVKTLPCKSPLVAKKEIKSLADSAVFSKHAARFPSWLPVQQLSVLHSELLLEKDSDCTQLTTPINNRESRQAAGWTRGIRAKHGTRSTFTAGGGRGRWAVMLICTMKVRRRLDRVVTRTQPAGS